MNSFDAALKIYQLSGMTSKDLSKAAGYLNSIKGMNDHSSFKLSSADSGKAPRTALHCKA